MFKNILLLTICLLPTSVFYAQSYWDGGGDGTTWEDPMNWEADALPIENDTVFFPLDATITGVANITPIHVQVTNQSTVAFELDLNIGIESSSLHAMIIGKLCDVTFGNDTDNYEFNFISSPSKQGLANFAAADSSLINVASGTTMLFNEHNTGINIAGPHTVLNNNGSIEFNGPVKFGTKVRGIFVNNGDITNSSDFSTDGIQVLGGEFINAEDGAITLNSFSDDGIEISEGGLFENNGTIDLECAADAGSGNNAIAIGTSDMLGTFINSITGVATLDGSVSENARAVSVSEQGELSNSGTLIVSGGNMNNRIHSRNVIVNNPGGVINLTDGRMNINMGSIVNNSYIVTIGETSGIFSNEGTEITNNAFFRYDNAGVFAIGMGNITDNGLKANMIDRVKLDAADMCEVDVANTAFDWSLNGEFLLSSDENGLLTFDPESLEADSVVLKTIIPDFTIKVVNICDNAIISALGETEYVNQFKVYPSVVENNSSIFIEGEINQILTIEFLDNTGRLLDKSNIQSNTMLNIPGNLPSGMNFVKIAHEHQTEIHKVIIK